MSPLSLGFKLENTISVEQELTREQKAEEGRLDTYAFFSIQHKSTVRIAALVCCRVLLGGRPHQTLVNEHGGTYVD